jgi:hypothetical protein
MTPPLPLRARLAVGVVVAALVAAVVGGTVAVQYGAAALQVSDGDVQSVGATDRVWFGLEVENRSALPVTLESVRAVVATDARIVEARVLDRRSAATGTGASGIGMVSPPLPADLEAALVPVAGYVLPPRSGDRFQVLVLVERTDPAKAAMMRQTDVVYSVLGLDHGFRSHAVARIRAP